jgi:hypothetical protein
MKQNRGNSEVKQTPEDAPATVPLVGRICSALVAVPFFAMGLLYTIDRFFRTPILFDSSAKFGIAALGCGVIFLSVASRWKPPWPLSQ